MEAELSKKCDELRQLFLLQQQNNSNSSTSAQTDQLAKISGTTTSSSASSSPTTTSALRFLRKQPQAGSSGSGTASTTESKTAAASEVMEVETSIDSEQTVANNPDCDDVAEEQNDDCRGEADIDAGDERSSSPRSFTKDLDVLRSQLKDQVREILWEERFLKLTVSHLGDKLLLCLLIISAPLRQKSAFCITILH